MKKSELIQLLQTSIEKYGDGIVCFESVDCSDWLEINDVIEVFETGVPDREAGDAAGHPNAIVLTNGD